MENKLCDKMEQKKKQKTKQNNEYDFVLFFVFFFMYVFKKNPSIRQINHNINTMIYLINDVHEKTDKHEKALLSILEVVELLGESQNEFRCRYNDLVHDHNNLVHGLNDLSVCHNYACESIDELKKKVDLYLFVSIILFLMMLIIVIV